jgi:hypothetical protein
MKLPKMSCTASSFTPLVPETTANRSSVSTSPGPIATDLGLNVTGSGCPLIATARRSIISPASAAPPAPTIPATADATRAPELSLRRHGRPLRC